ncbi:MAG: phosphoribosylformylglycinamidine cyclo-ligase [Ruminococcaceae bacterium]|nr:phosphoribosylformylglycinamidine cyclo-ligase [Oscillospiraceae bacterium]
MKSFSEAYKEAGVDITAGYTAVELMKAHIARTMTTGVCDSIGGFGGMFDMGAVMKKYGITDPILVSGTDGVGTKIRFAMLLDKHDTVGIDCVAMCVNDIICCGARPVFFLDYIACGRNFPEKIASIVAGVAEGCVQSGCALVGGETAEHPGMMPEHDYDLAGFAVGIMDRSQVVNNASIIPGDVMIALPSSGVHSNGFSLVRKVFDVENKDVTTPVAELGGKSLGEVLLTPTRIYVKPVLALLDAVKVKGISHITGGGFYENLPRALPDGITAKIEKAAVKTPVIFDLIAKAGNVAERDMFNTYNMGVGMAITVAKEDADKAVEILRANGEEAYIIGETAAGDEGVVLA